MRLWAKKKKGLKFDSGGMTNRVTGESINVTPPKDANAVVAEKLVFDRLELEYIPPTLRNTG
jgi:DNA polymerase/3'-5' exonuclease PolX